jgi:uncharacterized protein YbbK (DUF523 family)
LKPIKHENAPRKKALLISLQNKPVIAISSCILGQRVRYDGKIKSFPDIYQTLEAHFEFIAVCPEVEIGLTVPRPAVQLSGNTKSPKMTGRDNATIDISDEIIQFCNSKPAALNSICGYVFKSKSPSCGIRNISVFNQGKIISQNNRGLFAQAIINYFENLPIVDETELATEQQINNFIQQVLNYSNNKLNQHRSIAKENANNANDRQYTQLKTKT